MSAGDTLLRVTAPKNLQSGLVSIGVPVYNGAQYLRGALEALVTQDYENLEVIISDNGSEDDTELICREYAARDQRVRYYRAETNQGPFWNFVYVYELARGEYFMWAAHDDLRHPQYVSRCVAALELSPNALFCCTDVKFIDEKGGDVTETTPVRTLRPVGPTPRERLRGLARSTFWLDIYSLFRTPALADTSLGRMVWGGDILMVSQLCLRGDVALVPEPLFFYRQNLERGPEEIAQSLDPEGNICLSWIHLTVEVLRSIAQASLGPREKIGVAWIFTTEFCVRNRLVSTYIYEEGFRGLRHAVAHKQYRRALSMAALAIVVLPISYVRRAWTSVCYRLGRMKTMFWNDERASSGVE
jgi:Glycosyl transferase family 2